jgi:hypothetical protein
VNKFSVKNGLILDEQNEIEKCFNDSYSLGRHSLRGFMSMYQVSVWNRLKFLRENLNSQKAIKILESDIYRLPLFNTFWFENSMRYWEVGILEQYDRFVQTNRNLSFYITIAEVVLLILLILYIVLVK